MIQILVGSDIETVRNILAFLAEGNRTALHELANIRIKQEELFWKSLLIYEIEFVRPPETFFSSWHLQYVVENRMLLLEGPMWAVGGETPIYLYISKIFGESSENNPVWLIRDHRIP